MKDRALCEDVFGRYMFMYCFVFYLIIPNVLLALGNKNARQFHRIPVCLLFPIV